MANIQIPNLSAAIALNGTEQLEAVQAGASVRVTSGQLALYAANPKVTFNNYAALRLNTLPATNVFLLGGQTAGDGSGGVFIYEASDTTSADNGGTIIVDANNWRWYRLYEGAIYTSWFGTKGDGSTDDTAALQAAVTYALASGQEVVAPAGIYLISSTIVFSATADNRGFKFGGQLLGQDSQGVSFRLSGTGRTAIFQVNTNGHLVRYWQWHDFRLETLVSGGATYGFELNDTQYSQHFVDKVYVGAADGGTGGPGTAFAIVEGSGSNGEFIHFTNCRADSVNVFFSSNAGQAFMQRFDHCGCSLNSGGSYFKLNLAGGGGGGLIVTDFNATGTQTSGVSNTTLFVDGGQSSVVSFDGGRIEHLTQFYQSTNGDGGITSFANLEVTCDFNPTNGALTVSAPVYSTYGGLQLFRGIEVEAGNTACTFPVQGNGSFLQFWHVTFENCYFSGFARPPYGYQQSPGLSSSLIFRNCINSQNGKSNPINNVGLFERRITSQEFSVGSRSIDGDSVWAMAGLPDNQITHPEIASTTGSAVTPTSPWAASGTTLGVYDWNNPIGGNGGPYGSSQWTRLLAFAANQTLSQTISGVDLSSTTYARYVSSAGNFSRLTWGVFVRKLSGSVGNNANNNMTFTLSESAGGAVLDSVEYMQGQSGIGQWVILSCEYPKASSTTHPVITMTGGSTGTLYLEIDWQFFSTYTKPVFNPVTSPATNTQDIALSAETARVWDRWMLPYKPDGYGSTASTALPNLQTDEYVSSTDGFLTRYYPQAAGGSGAWGKTPNFFTGTAAPSTGTWNKGDIVWNTSPAHSGYVGWVCVTAGSPGTWYTFGAIS